MAAHPEQLDLDNHRILGQLNIADLVVLMNEHRNQSFFNWLFNNIEVCDWLKSNRPFPKLPIGRILMQLGSLNLYSRDHQDKNFLHFDHELPNMDKISKVVICEDHDFSEEDVVKDEAIIIKSELPHLTTASLGEIKNGVVQAQYIEFGSASENHALLLLMNPDTRSALTKAVERDGIKMKLGCYVIKTLADKYKNFAKLVLGNAELYSAIGSFEIALMLVAHPSLIEYAFSKQALENLTARELCMITENSEACAAFIFATDKLRNKLDRQESNKLASRHFDFAKAFCEGSNQLHHKVSVAKHFPTLAKALIDQHGTSMSDDQLQAIATEQPALGQEILQKPDLKAKLGDEWIEQFEKMLSMKQLFIDQISKTASSKLRI